MDKILTFIVNEYNEILLLKGSKNDPQFKQSFWYVVTGGCENYDLNKEETVKREVKEETNLLTNNKNPELENYVIERFLSEMDVGFCQRQKKKNFFFI